MTTKDNIAAFFANDNRSMMGGWVAPAVEAARKKAEKLQGIHRIEALKKIDERLRRENVE